MLDGELFTEADVISSYPDSDAVEDGVLVELTPKNRATRAVFDWLESKLPASGDPPLFWPVPLLAWIGAKTGPARAMILLCQLADEVGREARAKWEAGGTFEVTPLMHADGWLRGISKGANDRAGNLTPSEPWWIIPNELGGITVLYGRDY